MLLRATAVKDSVAPAAPQAEGLECDQPRNDVSLLVACARHPDRAAATARAADLTAKALDATGRGLDLTQADLSGLDLSGFDLRYATLNRAALFGTKLVGADMTGASMVCAGLERTDFTDAVLRGAYVHALAAQASTFVRSDLTGLVDATGALFHGCDLTGARLDNAELAGTTFYQCGLSGTQAEGADLHGAAFSECRMDGADLARARLDDVTITRSSLSKLVLDHARGDGLVVQRPTRGDGVRLIDAHLPGLRLVHVRARHLAAAGLHAPGIDVDRCQLPGADFSDADLSGGRWRHVNLDAAKLAGSVLTHSFLRQVSAVEADLTDATGGGLTASECTFASAVLAGFAGRYVTFRNCDLRSADLRGAYLYRSSFIGDPPASACMVEALLDGANLTQAYLAADFTGASIRHAWATYARINQSILQGADLCGTSLFRASAVKTQFDGAAMDGQRGAMFADRCSGLVTALRAAGDGASRQAAEVVEEMTALLRRDSGKST